MSSDDDEWVVSKPQTKMAATPSGPKKLGQPKSNVGAISSGGPDLMSFDAKPQTNNQ